MQVVETGKVEGNFFFNHKEIVPVRIFVSSNNMSLCLVEKLKKIKADIQN